MKGQWNIKQKTAFLFSEFNVKVSVGKKSLNDTDISKMQYE